MGDRQEGRGDIDIGGGKCVKRGEGRTLTLSRDTATLIKTVSNFSPFFPHLALPIPH
jgi:hypothetical protein